VKHGREADSWVIAHRRPWKEIGLTLLALLGVLGLMCLMVGLSEPFALQGAILASAVLFLFAIVGVLFTCDLHNGYRRFTLLPDELRISSRDHWLYATTLRLPADSLKYAHATIKRPRRPEEMTLAISSTQLDRPLLYTYPNQQARTWLAESIRSYYHLEPFTLEGLDQFTPKCTNCQYDLTGHVAAGLTACPECGKEMEPWQKRAYGLTNEPAPTP